MIILRSRLINLQSTWEVLPSPRWLLHNQDELIQEAFRNGHHIRKSWRKELLTTPEVIPRKASCERLEGSMTILVHHPQRHV